MFVVCGNFSYLIIRMIYLSINITHLVYNVFVNVFLLQSFSPYEDIEIKTEVAHTDTTNEQVITKEEIEEEVIIEADYILQFL